MKRRAAPPPPPSLATVSSRPIEFLPSRFFLLVVRETPRFAASFPPRPANNTPASSSPTHLCFPPTQGKSFIELLDSLIYPLETERCLDGAHTIRFCRFMNTMRRKHTADVALAAAPPPEDYAFSKLGKPRQIHFVLRSRVRGDDAAVIQLLVRWRLLSLHMPPADALAPFHHLQCLFYNRNASVPFTDMLAGIAKGIEAELAISKDRLLDDGDHDDEGSSGKDCDKLRPPPNSSHLTSITKRFWICASPVDALTTPSDPVHSQRDTPGDDSDPCPFASVDAPLLREEEADNRSSRLDPLTVSDLVVVLKKQRVTMLVKLNASPPYDDQEIIRSGIDHLDLSAGGGQRGDNEEEDQGISYAVVPRFLESCENAPLQGIIAVHSSTGLGRAAFCVGCFLVKHHAFSAGEAIGWIRFWLPEAIPPWHERLLVQMQPALSRDGDEYRRMIHAEGDRLGTSRRGSRASVAVAVTASSAGAGTISVDDNNLTSSSSPSISIGQISLGRDSLLGTKDKSRDRDGATCTTSTTTTTTGSPSQVRPTAFYSGQLHATQQLIASDTMLAAKRRPVTQGTMGRRRLTEHHHASYRGGDANTTATRAAEFSAMHKFLHQSRGGGDGSTVSSRNTGATYTGSHVTSLRPTATAPDRTTSGGTSRTGSKTEFTFD